MRKIKFRAWDIDSQKMYPVAFPTWNGGIDTRDGDHTHPTFYLNGGHGDNVGILLQFTGLLDKNGKEIYEGDIVKGIVKQLQLTTFDNDENCNTKMGGQVYYDYCGFSLKLIENLCEKERDGMCNYFSFMSTDDGDFDEIEVIGNIYENPEFLSESEKGV